MRESFQRELVESGYIHKLLPLHEERSTEARLLRKKVKRARELWDGKDASQWAKTGAGEIRGEGGSLVMLTPARVEPTEPMEHYTGFHHLIASLRLPGENLGAYNRLTCKVRPVCNGFHKPMICIKLRNEGAVKIPDVYNREGSHDVNLINRVWNDCVWEFPKMPRDKVTEISFSLWVHGTELFGENAFRYEIKDIRLEEADDPDVSLGWEGNESTVCHSTAGYWRVGRKRAVVRALSGDFALIGGDGKEAYTGKIEALRNEKGAFGVCDFTAFEEEGLWRLRVGENVTEPFPIEDGVMQEPIWKAINFLYGERCGYPVGGGHGYCHGDIVAEHGGATIPYNGGWHDAGDVSQQTLQSAEIVHALLEMKGRVKGDVTLAARLDEEARWGLDFVLRTRFGDGYRATSAGLSRWTDNKLGTFDDDVARVHNRSFDNFLMGGVEAFAGRVLREEDPELGWIALNAGREDFAFALERFRKVGVEQAQKMEHTHNASLSQYWAVIVWAASQLLAATGEKQYADAASEYAALLLSCQETGGAKLPFTGFFYRDAEKKAIVHFNHQSREHIFAQALIALTESQPDSPDRPAWEAALRRHGAYFKAMYAYAAPYGMLPAGVHRYDEPEDRETFPLLHLYTDYEADQENYREQLKAGVPLDDTHCLRHFPVWFSFRGNAVVHLAAGKAAGLIGKATGDAELMEIARDQIYFTLGQNPFGQSLMYGVGSNYAQQCAALAGELVGEIPVGIQTRGNEDCPYWPMANWATYKEIWTSSVGRWLWVVAELC